MPLLENNPARARAPAAPIQIQAPDGSIVEFPAGTDDATITSVMRRYYGGPNAPGAPASVGRETPPAPRMSDDLTPPQPKAAAGLFDDLIPAAPSKQPRPVNQGLDAPLYAVQRADRGIADALGAPVDLAAAGLNVGLWGADKLANLFGGSVDSRITNPVMGSDWIANKAAKAYDAVGGDVVAPEAVSPNVRMIGEASRYGTSALAGSVGLASRPAQLAAQSPGLMGRILRPLTEPYRNSASAVVGDAAAGAGAGTAVQSYDEYAPEGVKKFAGPLGPALATLAGGAGGATVRSAASGTAGLAKNLGRTVAAGRADPHAPIYAATGKPFTRPEMDEAARTIQAQAISPHSAAGNLAENVASLRDRVRPHEMPTSGAMSGDVGLALLEREARARTPRPFAERDRATNARAGEIVREAAPAGAKGRDFTGAADAIHRRRVSSAEADLEAARAGEASLAEKMKRLAAPVEATSGQGVRASQRLDAEIVDKSLRPMQERKNSAFGAIDPDRTVVRDATPLIEAAGAIRQRLGRLNDPSSILPTRTLDRIAALGGEEAQESVATGLVDGVGHPITRTVAKRAGGDNTITFGELNALRPELSSALAKARSAGDFALADNIQALQAAIHKETDRLAAEATPAGQRAAAAQKIYRDEFAPVWNPGPGDEATRFRRDVNADRQARTQSPPSATAGRFLRHGQPEKAESLRRIIETLPDKAAAQAEARRYLVADLAESGVVDSSKSQLRPDALRRWRNQWGDILEVVPGLRAEIDDMLAKTDTNALEAGRLAKEVRAAEGRLDDVAKNRGALGLVLGKDPVNAVQSVFNSGDPERAMKSIVGEIGTNRRAADGLKAAVVDYLTHKVSQPSVQKTTDSSRPIDFARLENLFDRHEATLAKVFSPEEMNALRQAHKLLKPQMELKQPSGAAPSLYENRKREEAWRMLEGALKARYGILKGGGILRTMRIFLSTLPNRDEAIRDIIVRMQFDPELAIHLLGRKVDPSDPLWNAKLTNLLAAATGARESVAGEQEQ